MYACRTLAIENSIRLCLSLKESYFKDLSNVCYRNITARKSDCHKPGPNCARETLRDRREYSRSGSTPSGGVKHKQALRASMAHDCKYISNLLSNYLFKYTQL